MGYILALAMLVVLGALGYNLVHSCFRVAGWYFFKQGVPHKVQESKDTIYIWLAGAAIIFGFWRFK